MMMNQKKDVLIRPHASHGGFCKAGEEGGGGGANVFEQSLHPQ